MSLTDQDRNSIGTHYSKPNDPTVVEKTVQNSLRAKKAVRKKEEGTDGIDAVDEISDEDRFKLLDEMGYGSD